MWSTIFKCKFVQIQKLIFEVFKQIYQQLRLQFGGRYNSQRLNINAFNNFDWCPMAGGTNEPLYCQQWCNVCLYDQHASKWPSNLVNTSDKSQTKYKVKNILVCSLMEQS